MTPALAMEARIKEEDRRRYFRADSGKGNIAPPAKATWFKIISVPCINGDDTPTVASWTLPGALDTVTTEHMHQVRAMVTRSDYREDARAENWVGNAVAEVVDLDLDDEASRKQVHAILKIWFTNGVLATEKRKDGNRHERAYVVPGKWNDEAATAP